MKSTRALGTLAALMTVFVLMVASPASAITATAGTGAGTGTNVPAPGTIRAHAYTPILLNGRVQASCRVDAGAHRLVFTNTCSIQKRTFHFFGSATWDIITVRRAVGLAKTLMSSPNSISCHHGSTYRVVASGQSDGFWFTSDFNTSLAVKLC